MASQAMVLVDTCVLLDDPDVLVRIRKKGGFPFLTSTVLDELDFNKSGKDEINKNARMIFREFSKESPTVLTKLPSGQVLHEGDILTRFPFRDEPVFLVARAQFRAKSNNDGKIIELAKDYGMVLVTRDNGMKVRAEAVGVKAYLWTGPPERQAAVQKFTRKQSDAPRPADPSSGITPFAVCKAPLKEPDTPVVVTDTPRCGSVVKLSSGASLRLGQEVNSGGEGVIYETDISGQVCKIYHANRLTSLKQKKIELMVSRRIVRPGICWPTEIVTNASGQFVGYLMPRAQGSTMQSVMFVKPKLEKTFPNWKRIDLVNVAGTFIDHVWFLHKHNIIIGDINPQNLLVTANSNEVWIVDTDSFQIEGFPCPVGTVNFTPAEIQGRNYSDFLRTVDDELFAVATMIFMILFPGKPPYSQQGGGSPAENIKSKNFPYRFYKDAGPSAPEVSGKDAPQGPWQDIWAHLPVSIRRAFFNTFREDKRTSVDEWTSLLKGYRDLLSKGSVSNDLFPLGYPIRDPIQVLCGKCGCAFTASEKYVAKLRADDKKPWCPQCTHKFRLERLAKQSQRVGEENSSSPFKFPNSSSPFKYPKTHQPTARSSGTSSGAPKRPTTSSRATGSRSNGQRQAPPPPRSGSAKGSSGLGGVLVGILKSLFK